MRVKVNTSNAVADKRKDEQDGAGAQRIAAGSLEQGTHAGGSLSGCFAPP